MRFCTFKPTFLASTLHYCTLREIKANMTKPQLIVEISNMYLNPVPTNWMALAGRLVIMLTPSLATVWMPEVPAEMTVAGARTRLPGTLRTKPVPGETRSMVNYS